jgi:hypothetical protein
MVDQLVVELVAMVVIHVVLQVEQEIHPRQVLLKVIMVVQVLPEQFHVMLVVEVVEQVL